MKLLQSIVWGFFLMVSIVMAIAGVATLGPLAMPIGIAIWYCFRKTFHIS